MKRVMLIGLGLLMSSALIAQSPSVKEYFENGAVKSEYVQEGNQIKVTHFYENGAVKESGFFLNGTPDGKWETFDMNGAKTAELNYKDGKRHGEFRSWDAYAHTYVEIRYRNGEMLKADKYLKDTDFAIRN